MKEILNANRGSQLYIYAGFAAFGIALFLLYRGVLGLRLTTGDLPRSTPITCVNNLKQIGLSAKTWALDNGDQFPFNVSTNVGGTWELCARGPDGFDSNAFLHLLVMSNEIATPVVFVCPQDRVKKPARDFAHLRPENVTYWLRSGPEVTDTHPQEVLARCPVDGNTLLCDGSVPGARVEPTTGFFADLKEMLAYNPQFYVQAIRAGVIALSGGILLLCGRHLRSKPHPNLGS